MNSDSSVRRKRAFSGYRLLGLGFWQAWWMIAMCTDALLPNENNYPFAGSTTLWVLVATTLGYLVIVLLSKRFSPFNTRKRNFIIAGVMTAIGSLFLPLSLTIMSGSFGFITFLLSTVAISVGNALLLIMWGELWSALATGRVGRHLYFSYSFAFILFFIGYFLPAPVDAVFTALLPAISAIVLYSCKDEPRRSPAVIPLDKKAIPYKSIFACIFAISVIYGFSQGVVESFSGTTEGGVFLAKGMLLAGFAIAAIAFSMVIAPPEVESITLYRPVIPAIAAGFIALILLPTPYGFAGAGLIIMGIYCLDMLIMLTSTDIAYRARIPVALSFGLGILASRTGTLLGSFVPHALLAAGVWSPVLRDDLMLAGILILILIGMLFFTQSDMQRFYQTPTVSSDQISLQEKCACIAKMCNLTGRETEVLVLLAQRNTVKGVCEKLSIAQGTAKHHVSNIYRKVGVFDRQGLHGVIEHGAVGKDSWEHDPQ